MRCVFDLSQDKPDRYSSSTHPVLKSVSAVDVGRRKRSPRIATIARNILYLLKLLSVAAKVHFGAPFAADACELIQF